MKICSGGVSGYRLHEKWKTLATIRHEPTPEVGTFTRSPDRMPRTANQREIKNDHCVGCTKPDIDHIMRSEITVNDPSLFLDKFLLDRRPLIPRRRDEARLPENLVQLDEREPRDVSQLDRQDRLA
jgi:hypothetical protein